MPSSAYICAITASHILESSNGMVELKDDSSHWFAYWAFSLLYLFDIYGKKGEKLAQKCWVAKK